MKTYPISFFVQGTPRPGGSKTACLIPKRGGGFVHSAKGRPIINMKESGKHTKEWRADVRDAARDAFQGDLLDVPVQVDITFVMPRPKGHYRSNGDLKPTAPVWHTGKPDALKLARSTEDAMTGIIYRDDSATVKLNVTKMYGERPGARITITPIEFAVGNPAAKPESAERAATFTDLFAGRVG